jgi:YD repeat-containing protein
MVPAMTARHVAYALVAAALLAPAAAVPALAAETYTYDTQSRLTDIGYQNGGSLHYTYDANGNILSVITSLTTAVEEGSATFRFALGPTTPNPGSGMRNVSFTLPAPGRVALRVFDVTGRRGDLVDHNLNRARDVRSSGSLERGSLFLPPGIGREDSVATDGRAR